MVSNIFRAWLVLQNRPRVRGLAPIVSAVRDFAYEAFLFIFV